MTSPTTWLDLPQVTLVAVSSVARSATIRALRLSMQQTQFGAVKFFSDHRPPDTDMSAIEHVEIDKISSRPAYSHFMLKELHKHIRTDFALCVQWDGYILDAGQWDENFLSYDYIGAPWPHFDDGMTVGNGGFSLRSRKLLQACANSRISCDLPEDVAICRDYRILLERQHGIHFAPEYIARRFAYERMDRTGTEFGFHGCFNMAELMSGAEFRQLLALNEPGLLGKRERRDLLRQAIARRDLLMMGCLAGMALRTSLPGWRR